jgi:hypothetical protein
MAYVPTMPPPEALIRYVDDILIVGGVPLPHFPRYAMTSFPRIPPGWPAFDAMVLMSRDEPFGEPTVRAAIFRRDEVGADDPHMLIEQAERGFGDRFAGSEVIVDDTVSGPDRRCRFRVRRGLTDREPGMILSLVGTVVATGDARPDAGLLLNGPTFSPVERLTREIAHALCRPVIR